MLFGLDSIIIGALDMLAAKRGLQERIFTTIQYVFVILVPLWSLPFLQPESFVSLELREFKTGTLALYTQVAGPLVIILLGVVHSKKP